jgi:hypothetical protein
MTTYPRSPDSHNPSEGSKNSGNTVLIGSCILCWGVVGLLVIAGSVAKLLGLF